MKKSTYSLTLLFSIWLYTSPAQQKRLVVIMFDGFGMSYYNYSPMPHLKELARQNFFKEVSSLMPSVTNANNASICTGTFPEVNGITGNTFLDASGHEEYMESKDLLLAPTLFQRLKPYGIKSALIASKKKSVALLPAGADIVLSPETADSSWINRLGTPANIYSADINYWSMNAALHLLKERPDIRCIYIHTTDYPMHMWAPSDSSSLKNLARMDDYIYKLTQVAPDAMIMVTADHDVNHKSRCVDLEHTLAEQNIHLKADISAEKDKYLKHHRGFGGASFIYLNSEKDQAFVTKKLKEIKGVRTVLTREEAAKKYHLMSSRIGDLVALADSLTVFGKLENKNNEELPENYRSHGSEYERRIPLFIINAPALPPASYFNYNKDLTAWLFEANYKNVLNSLK